MAKKKPKETPKPIIKEEIVDVINKSTKEIKITANGWVIQEKEQSYVRFHTS